MGFESYSDDDLRKIVEHWATQSPSPGSMGARAKRDSAVELERREAARRHPAGPHHDPAT